MEFSSVLVDQLDMLSDVLDDPGTDLHAILSVLTDDATAAVPSFLGLIFAAYLGEDAVTLSTLDSPSAGTSLLLTLAVPPGAPACEVVLYAALPGAFRELAADSRTAALALGRQVILDAHLPPPTARLYPASTLGIGDLSQINQAIGVLLDQGHTPAAARALLQDHADDSGITLAAAARQQLGRLP